MTYNFFRLSARQRKESTSPQRSSCNYGLTWFTSWDALDAIIFSIPPPSQAY